MKVYNEDKTDILTEYDLSKGHLKSDILITHIPAVIAVEEKSHYEVVAEYPNGGQDVEKVIDVAGVQGREAYDETEDIQIYVPYSEEELKAIDIKKQISDIKAQLADTDYKCLKFVDGALTEEEYEPIKQLRAELRQKINELESQL